MVNTRNPTLLHKHQERLRLLHIEQRWQVDTDWWSEAGHIYRDYVATVTREGAFCTFYYDHIAGAWFIEKVYD